MNTDVIERHFEKIGARAVVAAGSPRTARLKIDILRDEQGEYFEIAAPQIEQADVCVLDVQPRLRHLLLMSRDGQQKHKFLCGHDERHWFVAAVPERGSASTVQTAFEELRPPAVRSALARENVKPKKRNRRRNEAFVRQGEWFFMPIGDAFPVNPNFILRNEPLRRGNGQPHICEELVRIGGELVYVSPEHPNGLTEGQYRKLIQRRPKARSLAWITQRRNPGVFVRGKVRHPDHKTILLDGWHQVQMNTEHQSAAMRHVAFID